VFGEEETQPVWHPECLSAALAVPAETQQRCGDKKEHTVDYEGVFWVVLVSQHTLLQLVTFLTTLLFICFRVSSCLLTPSSLTLRRDTCDTPLLYCLL
jgi:hypothetical protein